MAELADKHTFKNYLFFWTGQLFSILNTLVMIASPIGAIISGPLSELFGVSWLYFYCAIFGIIISISIYMFTSLRHVDFDKELNGNTEINKK